MREDPRERDFLASLEALYSEGGKTERDRACLLALERMASRYPDDHEVQLFYALALTGVNAGVRDVPTYMQSTAVSQWVFCVNPRHPGAAHFGLARTQENRGEEAEAAWTLARLEAIWSQADPAVRASLPALPHDAANGQPGTP
jgi:hypothetical protein